MEAARIVFAVLVCIPFLWILCFVTIKLAREISNRSNINEQRRPEADEERQVVRKRRR